MLVRQWYGKLVRHILFFGTYRNVPVLQVRIRIPQLTLNRHYFNEYFWSYWRHWEALGAILSLKPPMAEISNRLVTFTKLLSVWHHLRIKIGGLQHLYYFNAPWNASKLIQLNWPKIYTFKNKKVSRFEKTDLKNV